MEKSLASFGCQSMVAPIRRLLLKHPREAFENQDHVTRTWRENGFMACPDYDRALAEYDAFAGLLSARVADITYLPQSPATGLDSIYVHDPMVVSDRGAILCRMGRPGREAEPEAAAPVLASIGLPVCGAIAAAGRLEGGDVLWVGPRALAVGQGYRTNAEGIRQLQRLTADSVDELHVVPLPHWDGPDSCLHLMSFISMIDDDLAVVYSRLMPVPFRQWLLDRGLRLVEVPDTEYETLACNVLALAPRACVMVDGNPQTRRRLEAEGVAVFVFAGNEICHKGMGGPTCLTRPLLRA